MAGPILLTSSSANRIRSSVTAISMPSKPFGIVGSGGQSKIPIPMPFDISIAPVTSGSTTTYHPRVSLIGLWVSWGRGDMDLDRRNSAISSLVTAWDNGDNYWDLGEISNPNNYSAGMVFYVVARLIENPSQTQAETKPFINELYWGITKDVDVIRASQLIPAVNLNPSNPAAGQVTGCVCRLPLGGVNTANGRQYCWQGFHGNVFVPPVEDVDLVVDVQYDTTNHQLQKKTTSCLVFNTGLESDWTMIEGGQAELYP